MTVVPQDDTVIHFSGNARLDQSNTLFSFRSASEYAKLTSEDFPCPNTNTEASIVAANKVAVILGYYDGEAHVAEQLKSIFEQSHQALHVFVSDDQSPTPFSVNALSLDTEHLAKLSIGSRPENTGFTSNFLNTLACIDGSFEYFAFSDQDDIWRPDKIEKAINVLSKSPKNLPALYCARTEIADEACQQALGYSPIFNKPPSFANALVQSIAGGNTMVFNKVAKDLIVATTLNSVVVSHDWWCYQIVTGAGGYVVYDSEPCLSYRQHDNNLVGANTSWRARLLRIRGLLQSRFRTWNDINLKALADHKHLLTNANLCVLNDFIEARQSPLLKRLVLFKRSGIYRQSLFGNLGLLFGILLNKV